MRNSASLILGFGQKIGPGPNQTSEKWVGHFQELRRNDTSLVLGFGHKSGPDPNCVTEKWVRHFHESRQQLNVRFWSD